MMKKPRENRVPIMMSDEELEAIDGWRFANRVATRSDAVRRLCQIGLLAEKQINRVQPSLEQAFRGSLILTKMAERATEPNPSFGAEDIFDFAEEVEDSLSEALLKFGSLRESILPYLKESSLPAAQAASRKSAVDALRALVDLWAKRDKRDGIRSFLRMFEDWSDETRREYEEMSPEARGAFIDAELEKRANPKAGESE